MFEEVDVVFDKIKRFQETIECGVAARNADNLEKVVGLVAQIYWMLSQTLPYKRGSAGIADLATKATFDYLGVHVPCWKENSDANIMALLYEMGDFKHKYASYFKEPLEWKKSGEAEL